MTTWTEFWATAWAEIKALGWSCIAHGPEAWLAVAIWAVSMACGIVVMIWGFITDRRRRK